MKNRTDHIYALKVAGLLIVMLLCFEAASGIGNWVAKPIKAQKLALLEQALGPKKFDCINGQNIQREQAEIVMVQSQPKIRALERESTVVSAAITAIDAGLLYLFSYIIVRVCRRRDL